MGFEIHQVEDTVWYAPDVEDNREKHDVEQFAVQLTPMSAADMRRAEESKVGKVTRAKFNWARRYNALRADVLRKCIRSVRNCTFVTTKDGRQVRTAVTTGEALLAIAGEDLLEELLGALKDQSRLADGLVGKSNSPSASPTRATPRGNGDAAGAAGESDRKSPSDDGARSATATERPTPTSASTSPPISSAAPGLS